ncbi:MAG: hypothetical protein JWM33_3574 [Caulobacteraceae bacterium]|nr:hypothetical protein [Caulobacteraceae bacterium]
MRLPLLAVFLSLGLAGCGFVPLYATGGLPGKLSSIEVVAPDGRAGYLLGQALNDSLAVNRAVPSAYRLDLTLTQARVERGVRNNAADRYELTLTADYNLVDKASGAVIYKGSVEAEVTTDTADQPYAGIAAQNDAEQRAANETARRIQLDLARWLSSQSQSK